MVVTTLVVSLVALGSVVIGGLLGVIASLYYGLPTIQKELSQYYTNAAITISNQLSIQISSLSSTIQSSINNQIAANLQQLEVTLTTLLKK